MKFEQDHGVDVVGGGAAGSMSSLPFWTSGFSFVSAVDAIQYIKFLPLDRQNRVDGSFITADNVDACVDLLYGDTNAYDGCG